MPRVRTEPIVYIGEKPTMSYVFEVLGQLNSGTSEVRVKARGKAISKAVDVAEVARRHKLLEGRLQVGQVRIGTERLTNRDGRDANVSSIEIVLTWSGGGTLVGPAPAAASAPPPGVGRPTGAGPGPSETSPTA